MYIHALNPVLINFGFIEIRWYSLAYIFGILIGWWIANKIIIFKIKNKNIALDVNIFDELINVIGMMDLGKHMGFHFNCTFLTCCLRHKIHTIYK